MGILAQVLCTAAKRANEMAQACGEVQEGQSRMYGHRRFRWRSSLLLWGSMVHAGLTQGTPTTLLPLSSLSRPEGPWQCRWGEMKTTEGPMKITEGPMKTTEGPMKTTEGPMKTTEGPMKTTEGPMNITEGPMNITEGPMKTTGAPSKRGPAAVAHQRGRIERSKSPPK